MRLRRGSFGVIMERSETLVTNFIGNYSQCNVDRMKHFRTEMGPNYVGLSVSALPQSTYLGLFWVKEDKKGVSVVVL